MARYYAAAVADRTLAGWVDLGGRRRAHLFLPRAVHRRISLPHRRALHRCRSRDQKQSAALRHQGEERRLCGGAHHPTGLIGDVTGPLTLAEVGEPPSLVDDGRARA